MEGIHQELQINFVLVVPDVFQGIVEQRCKVCCRTDRSFTIGAAAGLFKGSGGRGGSVYSRKVEAVGIIGRHPHQHIVQKMVLGTGHDMELGRIQFAQCCISRSQLTDKFGMGSIRNGQNAVEIAA